MSQAGLITSSHTPISACYTTVLNESQHWFSAQILGEIEESAKGARHLTKNVTEEVTATHG